VPVYYIYRTPAPNSGNNAAACWARCQALAPGNVHPVYQPSEFSSTMRVINLHNTNDFYAWHTGGVNVAMADGSVRFLSESVPFNLLGRLVSRAGGEIINPSDF
jgi:prepilin-type processing-associated H-X9-DG protein